MRIIFGGGGGGGGGVGMKERVSRVESVSKRWRKKGRRGGEFIFPGGVCLVWMVFGRNHGCNLFSRGVWVGCWDRGCWAVLQIVVTNGQVSAFAV